MGFGRGTLRRIFGAAFTVALLGLPAAATQAATYPSGFEEDTLVSGLTIPTTAAWAPDGRIFVAEKSGVLKVVSPGETTGTTILDISDKVNDSYDRGLLGIALDTDFESNGYLYLLYVYDVAPLMADSDGAMVSRLTRIQVSGSNTVSAETVLLGSYVSGPCPPPSNTLDCISAAGRSHAIGTVISAPDGTLYVGSGDASSYTEFDTMSFRAYDESSFAGKILHIDRNGKGLGGHQFCPSDTNLDHVCTKIHSKGFRNPFRFELRADGSLAVGEVGWNAREEIDFISSPGHSYGWPCYEGITHTPVYADDDRCDGPGGAYSKEGTPEQHLAPAFDYEHTSTNSVIGGPIYSGGDYPDDFDGDMIFGDYSGGFLKRLHLDAGGAVTGTTDFATGWGGVDLMLTPGGDVAFPDFGTGEPGTGSLKRIVYAPSAGTPNAVATATPVSGAKPLSVNLSAADSLDPEGQTLAYSWDFDDPNDPGATSTAVSPTHEYTDAGTYHPVVTVDDGDGHTDSQSVTVEVFDSPPTPVISSPADESTYRDGDTISLSGSATDAEDGTLPAAALSWTVILHHGAHTHQAGTFTGTHPSFTAQRDHDGDSYYEVRLRATDTAGEWRQTSIDLRPATVPFQLLSTPAGAPVAYGGKSRTAPFSTDSAIGLRTSVSAGPRFSQGGEIYHFNSWSDGSTGRVHQVEIPASASSETAVYYEDKAFEQSARASSVEDVGFEPTKATDDDPSTRWASWSQTADPSPTWEVDLGSVRSVSALEIDWQFAYASRYDVLTSVDGTHWSVVANESIGGPIKRRTTFPVRTVQYVRVHALEHGSVFGVSFFEARVLGPPDGDPVPEDKAAGGPTTASSSDPSFVPADAVDDDSDTRWSSTSSDAQWWQVDLGSQRTVDTVELNWEDAYASRYQIQTSPDGASFSTAATVDITKAGIERTGFAPRVARFVRVLGVNRATGSGISFWDARVYGGADPVPDTTPPDTTITSGPSGTTSSRSASLEFSSEAGAGFECSLDGAAFAPCVSPRSYGGLADGPHSFSVRAGDAAGNVDPTPATRDWTVAPTGPPSPNFRDVVRATPGLVGLWPLGERGTAAGNLAGASGGRYRGGAALAPALVAGTPDGARHFDGRNDRVAIGAQGLGRSSRLTLALWVKRDGTRGSRRRLLVSGSRTPLADGFTLLLDARGRPVLALGGKHRRRGALTGPALATGRTYQLAATYDGRRMSLYVNARKRASRAYAGGVAYPRAWSLSFGAPARGGSGLAAFAGVIDEVALFGTALGQPALAEQFRLGAGPG